MPAAGALVTAQPDPEGGGAPTERDMRQLTGHAVTNPAVPAAAMTPVIRLDRATQQDRALVGEVLGHHQAEAVKAPERAQIRHSEDSVVHIEVP